MEVPVCTQMIVPSMSAIESKPESSGTSIPWPSKKVVAVHCRPRAPSREAVHVPLRISTSMSPDCSAVNRVSAVRSVYSTASGSPRTAAATALQ